MEKVKERASWDGVSFLLRCLFICGPAGSSLLNGLFSSCGEWGPLSTALRLHCWVGFSLVVASGGRSPRRCVGFSLQWRLLLWSVRSRVLGIQWLWHVGSVAAIPWLWSTGSVAVVPGLVAPGHVGFSQIRDQTHDSCISRWILYHPATSEALK